MAMIKIRTSITGTEYWDSEKKRTVVIPKDRELNFDISEQTDATITGKVIVGDGVLFKSGEEIRLSKEALDSDGNTAADFEEEPTDRQADDETTEVNGLDGMTAKQLRAYAKKNAIDIPAAIRSKGDILQIIQESGK